MQLGSCTGKGDGNEDRHGRCGGSSRRDSPHWGRRSAAEIERATESVKELSGRRVALVPGVSSSADGVTEELATLIVALDEEAEIFSRTRTIAEDAARELDQNS